jgi:hypothetical protein
MVKVKGVGVGHAGDLFAASDTVVDGVEVTVEGSEADSVRESLLAR